MTDPAPPTGLRLDATSLRVLAHPLRSRLLSRLRVDGPATATELAGVLSTNTGATSYHLRKLESVGLVTDTGEGEGKRRLWRASTDFHSFDPSDYRDDDEAAAAVGWLQRDYVRQMASRAEGWFDAADRWPDAWVDAAGYGDTHLTVTAAQLRQVSAELFAVLERWRTAGAGDPAARRVLVSLVAQPADVTDPPPAEVDR
ncbi:Helix-turn-helix domain-containing protein [Friedmanniella luteola]|uniref:Helix-turn-helix domain-containing protein n=1 Tax=Friedmanniella luteola TaxID=546871 RepID=A0A1H1TTV4_9ACTN|nr:winged helix-turn-helix domain-containing protein [Friedmanniella luteola]SDS63630.1 Helix-turn-helix domain-containing protein [Friedmanniella luteola]